MLFKEFKQGLDSLNFTIFDYFSPFKSYISSVPDQDFVKFTRSVEKHELSNFTKNTNMIGKRQTMKKNRVSIAYSKRTSTFLMKIGKDFKSPRKNDKKSESPLLKQVSFDIDENSIEKDPIPNKSASIYKNRLSTYIKNDFLSKCQEENTEEKTEDIGIGINLQDTLEQEIFIVESPRKKNEGGGKLSDFSERIEVIYDKYASTYQELEESDSESDSDDEEEISKNPSNDNDDYKPKLYHSKTENTKGFLMSKLIKEEKFPLNKRKKTFSSPKHFRIKPKKNTAFTSEMSLLLQKEPWIHTTGITIFLLIL